MGLVTEAEGNYAATAASEVGGIAKVVKLFEVISREEALRLSGPGTQPQGAQSNTAPQQHAAPHESGGGGAVNAVQAIPIHSMKKPLLTLAFLVAVGLAPWSLWRPAP